MFIDPNNLTDEQQAMMKLVRMVGYLMFGLLFIVGFVVGYIIGG